MIETHFPSGGMPTQLAAVTMIDRACLVCSGELLQSQERKQGRENRNTEKKRELLESDQPESEAVTNWVLFYCKGNFPPRSFHLDLPMRHNE